jgi:hypothetical protein
MKASLLMPLLFIAVSFLQTNAVLAETNPPADQPAIEVKKSVPEVGCKINARADKCRADLQEYFEFLGCTGTVVCTTGIALGPLPSRTELPSRPPRNLFITNCKLIDSNCFSIPLNAECPSGSVLVNYDKPRLCGNLPLVFH